LAATAVLLLSAEKAGVRLSGDVLGVIEGGLSSLGASPGGGAGAGALAERIQRLLSVAREDLSLRAELRDLVRRAPEQDPQALLSRLLRELEDRHPVVILDGL